MLAAAASNYEVEIVRDTWGVPHIFGKTDNDAAFGLAYAHAEDDFETIQATVAATRGVLARYKGASAAPTDYLIELLNVWDTIDERYESEVPADVKAYAQAYADGLNLYASENSDKAWTGLAPFNPQDIFAGSMTSAKEITPSSSFTRPSMKDCFSLAEWYSAFSERSPCSRASAMARMIVGRSTVFRCFSSTSKSVNPLRVIGIFSIASVQL